MKLMLLLADTEGGGAQRTMVNLANGLAAEGTFDVKLVVGRSGGAAEAWISSTVDVIDLNAPRARFLPFSLSRKIDAVKPDAVLSSLVHANVAAWLGRSLSRSKPALLLRETNTHRHRPDFKRMMGVAAGLAYRRAERVIALSEGVGKELVGLYDLQPDRVVTIHNPVGIDLFHRKASERKALPALPRRFVAVGRLAAQKNFSMLIEAFAAGAPEDAELTIYGDGPEREMLTGRIEELGLAGRINLPGFVSDMPAELIKHDTFLLSSLWEGFGHVIVEALAAGLPVIATDCPYGPRDILKNREAGLLVENDNISALADAIRRISTDRALYAQMRRTAAEAAEPFAINRIVGRYRDEILTVLDQRV